MKRNTWQRAAVRDALARRSDFVSAQELYAELKRTGSSIGLATVYRALAGLSTEGEADSLRDAAGESRYRACATSTHHHHLICRSCGRAVEIEADAVEEWAAATAAAHGFLRPQHVVDVFGICAECSARGAEPGRDQLLSRS